MPPPRRTKQHVESLDAFGQELRLYTQTVEEVMSDGLVEPNEAQLLHRVLARVAVAFAPLPAQAAVIDSGVHLIATLTETMSVTTWTERRIKEAAADEQRLVEDGLLEPIKA